MAKTIYISDTGNNRIIERALPGLAYVDQMTSYDPGGGPVAIFNPTGICTDGTFFYVAHDTYVMKFSIPATTISDAVYVSETSYIMETKNGICTDGTYLFVIHLAGMFGRNYVERFLCSDMSYVDGFWNFNASDSFVSPVGITTDGTKFYVTDSIVASGRVIIFQNSDLSYIDQFFTGDMAQGIDNDGVKLYVALTAAII